MKKALKIGVAVVVILFGSLVGLLSLRKDWIEPLPGVRMAPIGPVRGIEDIAPGCAFDLLMKACDLPPGAAEIPWEETERLATNEWDDVVFSNLVAILDLVATNLALAKQAAQVPDPWAPVFSNSVDVMKYRYFFRLRGVVDLLNISARRKTAHGDIEGAFADIECAVRFPGIVSEHGMSGCMMNYACTARSLTTLRRIALTYEVPPALATSSVQWLSKIDEERSSFAESLRYDAIMISPLILELYSKTGIIRDSFGDEPEIALMFAMGRVLGSGQEITTRNMVSYYSHAIAIAEKPYDPVAWAGFEANTGPSRKRLLLSRDPVGLYLAGPMFSGYNGAHVRHVRTGVDLRITQIVLMLEQFRKKTGRLPTGPDELVPDYLPVWPLDPFDGKPLRYVPRTNGTWKVYSVGPDLKDDGGNFSWRDTPVAQWQLSNDHSGNDIICGGSESATNSPPAP